jgi:hypothetical protein
VTIFISIASYSDKLLKQTILDAIDKAKFHKDLRFGIVEQSPHDMRLNINQPNFKYVGIDPKEARGVCWARSIAMSLYGGETWYFQIDSHMLFDQDWDVKFIKAFEALPTQRAVISSFPCQFQIKNGENVKFPLNENALAHVISVDFKKDVEDDFRLGVKAITVRTDTTLKGFHAGAGCLFSPAQIVQCIPYDPWYYFNGEEQALAARLFTHGWDIYHMPEQPVYHLYAGEEGAGYRLKHWSEEEDKARRQRWWELDGVSKERLKYLLSGGDLGIYGLGTRRTMEDYKEFCGIDYVNKTINERSTKGPWEFK